MGKKRGQEGRNDAQGKRPGLGSPSVSGERDRTWSVPGVGPQQLPLRVPVERSAGARGSRGTAAGGGEPRRSGAPHRHTDREPRQQPAKLPGRAAGRGWAASPVPPATPGPPNARLLPHHPRAQTGGVPRPAGRSGAVGAPRGLPRRRTPAKDTGYRPAGGTSSAAGSPGSGRKRRRGPAPGRAAPPPPSRRCPPPCPPAPTGPRPRTGH